MACIDRDPVAHFIESCQTGGTGGVGPVHGGLCPSDDNIDVVMGENTPTRYVFVCLNISTLS
jgi:hypothetical protein